MDSFETKPVDLDMDGMLELASRRETLLQYLLQIKLIIQFFITRFWLQSALSHPETHPTLSVSNKVLFPDHRHKISR